MRIETTAELETVIERELFGWETGEWPEHLPNRQNVAHCMRCNEYLEWRPYRDIEDVECCCVPPRPFTSDAALVGPLLEAAWKRWSIRIGKDSFGIEIYANVGECLGTWGSDTRGLPFMLSCAIIESLGHEVALNPTIGVVVG